MRLWKWERVCGGVKEVREWIRDGFACVGKVEDEWVRCCGLGVGSWMLDGRC